MVVANGSEDDAVELKLGLDDDLSTDMSKSWKECIWSLEQVNFWKNLLFRALLTAPKTVLLTTVLLQILGKMYMHSGKSFSSNTNLLYF